MKKIALLLVTLLVAPTFAIDQKEIDRIIKPAIDGKWCDCVAVGVIEPFGTQTFNYGAVGPTTLFEIGSATKVFTSLALADMVNKKEVALDDPIEKYLPAGGIAPKFKDKSITLLDLATHRSGLPRLPDNLEPKNPQDPYADYDAKRLLDFLSHHKLGRAPGKEYEYSNLGAGLLGYLLAQRAGQTYEQLIVERICKPLDMQSTSITPPGMAAAITMPAGHNADGDVESNWNLDALAGAGALRSTVNDLLKFLAANISPPATPLGEAIKLSQQRRAAADPGNDIALGWQIGTKRNILWHNGGTGGYHSFIALSLDKKCAVVILCNTATGVIDDLGARLIRTTLGESVEPPKLRQPARIDPKILDDYLGEYALTPLFKITITRNGDQLSAQASGQPAAKIYPESDTKFFYKVVDAQLTFERNADGKVVQLFLDQNGQHLPGKRAK